MHTLVETASGSSFCILEDGSAVSLLEDRVVVSYGTQTTIIADRNKDNTVLYSGVNPPADWEPDKYLFDGTSWALK
jgi:hypothetical protein